MPSPFIAGDAAFVDCWGGAELVEMVEFGLRLGFDVAGVSKEPVESGVSPEGMDKMPVTEERIGSVMMEVTIVGSGVSPGGMLITSPEAEAEGSGEP